MSVYTVYQELFPPQTVEHVETSHFTSPDAINLVVAKASLLQIYEFVEYIPEPTLSEDQDDEEREDDEKIENNRELANERLNEQEDMELVFPKIKAMRKDITETSSGRLELVAQYKLNGTIATMGVVKTSSPRGKEGCDSLLLGFNDAKMSLLEWSPATNSIVTVSIHYYERDDFKKEFLNNPYPSSIHIDPQQRCAVLNFYDNKMAVLPFRQADKLDERQGDLEDDEETQKWPYLPSFLIDLESIEPRIKNVVDMVFLSDYYEPTLAILFQSDQTWTGRLGSVKDTMSVVVISLDLTAKIYPIIYSIDKLPYDCIKLVAMPKPVTGVLVIAANSFLHVSQGSPGVGVAVNGYTKKTTEFPGMLYEDHTIQLGLSLDGAKAFAFGGDRCLVFMQNGNWAVVQMKMDGSKVVGMNIDTIEHDATPEAIVSKSKQALPPLAIIPSCVTNVKDGYFFLGSRVGDSLLIKWKYSKEMLGNKTQLQHDTEFTFKVCDTLLNTGPIVDMTIGDVESNQLTEEEEEKQGTLAGIHNLELVSCSGHGKNGALCVFQRHIQPQTSFSFTQSDSQAIWAIKCRKDSASVEPTRKSSTTEGDSSRWELIETDSSFDEAFDKLLFISKSKSTMVLSAGDELQELVKTGFYTKGPTIAVNTLFDATRIVQVYSTGMTICTPEGKRMRNVSIPIRGAKVIDASIRDPYILLTLDTGRMLMYQGDAATKDIALVQLPSIVNKTSVSMASIFADTSGLFSSISEKIAADKARKAALEKAAAAAARTDKNQHKKRKATAEMANGSTNKKSNIAGEFDEVDMDLYGDQLDDDMKEDTTAVDAVPTTSTISSDLDNDDDDEMLYGTNNVGSTNKAAEPNDIEALLMTEQIDESNVSLRGGELNEITRVSFWALVYTTEGTLQICSLPDFKECFVCPQFDIAPDLITDNRDKKTNSSNSTSAANNKDKKSSSSKDNNINNINNTPNIIQELLMTNIGKERKDPHLVARTETNDIIIYKAFSFIPTDNSTSDRLALRFSRVHHEYVSRKSATLAGESKKLQKKEIIDEFDIPSDDDLDDEDDDDDNDILAQKSSQKNERSREKLLVPFNDVAGYAGVFVAGAQPAWLMNSCKSFVRVHPMKSASNVIGFTQFHNVNCQHGFITVDDKNTIRLSRLRTDGVIYDLDWVMQKIPLGQSVHKIQYHPIMRVYAVLVSTEMPVKLQNEDDIQEGETPASEEKREPGEFLPQIGRFQMIMVSPVTWEIVDTVEFEEFEQCFSLQCAALESKQTSTGRKHFMVVGTGGLRGEDTTMRGSIRIFDIIEVVPEPNNPQTNHKFKHLHTEDVKGAVTAMCNLSGHLASCIGSKVIVWSLEDDESLVGVAFIDVQIYVTSMSSIKNFILLGDAQKSIWFLGFQLEPAKLSLLGKDYQSFEVGCVDFIIDDKSLYLVVGDTNENLDIYQYAPFNLQSFGGQKLMRRGDFHVGSQVQTMVRLPQIEKTDNNGYKHSQRHFCLCGTFSGSISVLSPISEKTFKRLSMLYGQLVNNVQHVAGLNPRAHRLIKGPKQRMATNRTKAVLDGDLIFEFAGLSINRQKEITKQIGTAVPRIMEDLVDIETSIDHF